MSVPAFDLSRARTRIADELDARWRNILAKTAFVGGPEVAAFEHAYGDFIGTEGCVGVGNGTDALILSLRALGVSPGDEVVVPAFTFYATAEAVVISGGHPVFADVEKDTLNLDPDRIEEWIGDTTVGVVGVHLYGRPCDVDRLRAVCDRNGLWLLEDAAQAQGAAWGGKRVGGFGDLAAWSFYPSKNLGCFGDGGAVTGNDPELLERVRRLANHGQESRYSYVEVGANSRLDALQAAVLNCRLPRLDEDNARRRELACRYYGMLEGVGDLDLPKDPPEATSVYHQMTIMTDRRDELAAFLAERGIGTAIHYPQALHQIPPMIELLGEPASLPVAERAASRVLSLPMFAELTDEEADEVGIAIQEFFKT